VSLRPAWAKAVKPCVESKIKTKMDRALAQHVQDPSFDPQYC
jgi:hypothetical protein